MYVASKKKIEVCMPFEKNKLKYAYPLKKTKLKFVYKFFVWNVLHPVAEQGIL